MAARTLRQAYGGLLSPPGGWAMRQTNETAKGGRSFPRMSPDRNQSGQLKRVLCIDDEDDFQSVIRISLERVGGIQAHFCNDPQHAIAKAHEVKPDLILLDFMMPALDGPAVFKLLRADPELAGIPVVFLTAVMTGPGVRELHTLGAAGVLIKPFDLIELPRKLSAIWAALKQ